MKKLNKKGFTLAELLIVVGIIAILMAIAVPVFTAQLRTAQLATDHSNMRSAYGVAQVNYSTGELKNGTYYVQPDGKLLTGDAAMTSAYRLKATAVDGDCDEASDGHQYGVHKKDYVIVIKVDDTNGVKLTTEQ